MKNLLKSFIQGHGSHCLLILFLLEPLYRNYYGRNGLFDWVAVILLFFFLVYPLVIAPFVIALHPHRTYHKESKESILLTVYICILGALSQYLLTPEGDSFNAKVVFWLLFMAGGLIDILPDHFRWGKKKE